MRNIMEGSSVSIFILAILVKTKQVEPDFGFLLLFGFMLLIAALLCPKE